MYRRGGTAATLRISVIGLALILLAGACGGDDDGNSGNGQNDRSLTVYSGREEEYVAPLFEQFEADTGIDLDVRYGDSAELAATIVEEGDASPADVFFPQDAGSLGAVAEAGLFQTLPEETLGRIDARFVSPDGLWVGTSGRARVAVYNTDLLSEEELPDSILEFTSPEWKGRFGFPPTNASFQAFVAAMIVTDGEDATLDFLQRLVDNEPKLYEDNAATTRAVGSGEVEVGFVNHYYLYEVSAEDGDLPAANHFFAAGDPGALVNAAGVGILATSDAGDAALALVDYLTGEDGQTFFAEKIFEYPVNPSFEARDELVPLDDIESPAVDLTDLGGALEPALRLLAEVGLL